MDLRRPLPSSIHNTREKSAVDCVKDGAEEMGRRTDNWYKRWENNGWRMVPSRVSEGRGRCNREGVMVFDLVCQLFKRLDQDEIQTATASMKQEFHYSKVGPVMHGSELTSSRWTTYQSSLLVFLVAAEKAKRC